MLFSGSRDIQDKKKPRPILSQDETQTRMEFEDGGLEQLCPEHSIVYRSIGSGDSARAKALIQAFATQRERDNTDLA